MGESWGTATKGILSNRNKEEKRKEQKRSETMIPIEAGKKIKQLQCTQSHLGISYSNWRKIKNRGKCLRPSRKPHNLWESKGKNYAYFFSRNHESKKRVGEYLRHQKKPLANLELFIPMIQFFTNKKRRENVLDQKQTEEICCQYKCQAIEVFQGKGKLSRSRTSSVNCV